ncbi:UDP-N-acetylglucosamine 2-epimerase [Synechococcus sp. NOUM97013]|uniref:UDP-N-acetylglucosamine 2-epimerase n=1 Tax=Synechococcus sp. NOUM97013 TaxID=1442555 RepID=UPI001647F42D|nr:UDP-N-acetylglucosamine 2-epimerase [Synechococcus sp. NOUM97013]QNI72342.1 UDP-N/N'-diacetylbacillosamine 2-epimerase (hydrolysing) [Synechococcus sp. NOUM97013]
MSISCFKICVVTGTRAEYGLLRWVMQGILASEVFDLQLIVTGMHLSPEFGFTVQEIEADGFIIDRKVEMLLSSDTPVGITKSMGLGMIGFADALVELQPDLLLVLGDRFETFAAASAALIARIPIAHCHGGELTEGAFDDSLRHSITKMAHLHFVAAEEYRQRVIQMGEHPDRVFLVGGLGVEAIKRSKLLSREEIEVHLDFKLGTRNLLITFHPVTLEQNTSAQQMGELLAALDQLPNTHFIFTMPNADTDGRVLFRMIKEFCAIRDHAKAYTSLGQLRYFSCIRYCDAVVGNSSSGLLEVPYFNIPTVNIGDRQKGRIREKSVIDCGPFKEQISTAIQKALELNLHFDSPLEVLPSSALVLNALESCCDLNLKKEFYKPL